MGERGGLDLQSLRPIAAAQFPALDGNMSQSFCQDLRDCWRGGLWVSSGGVACPKRSEAAHSGPRQPEGGLSKRGSTKCKVWLLPCSCKLAHLTQRVVQARREIRGGHSCGSPHPEPACRLLCDLSDRPQGFVVAAFGRTAWAVLLSSQRRAARCRSARRRARWSVPEAMLPLPWRARAFLLEARWGMS